MTTLLKKDYQYSSVLWEEVMQRVQEIIRDEYNISPYVAPTLNPKTPSPFRIWTQAQGTETLYGGAWHKEYTISVNHYLKTEDSERFYKKVYEESERLYQLFFNNQGTKSTEILGFFGGEPEGIQITQEGDYFRIEVLFTCQVFRADDVVYVVTAPSSIRASTRAISLPYNFWSLDFDGSDGYINTGSYNLTAPFAISIWFQAGGMTSGVYRTLFSHSNDLRIYTINKTLYESGTETSYLFSASSTSGWQHLVLVDDDSNRSMYLNGSVILSNYKTSSDSTAQSGGVLVGEWSTATSRPMKGRLSEVSVFNSTLSSSEIESIYNNGQPILLTENQGSYKSSGDLVAYYRMGSGSGDDRSTNGLIADQVDSSIGGELLTNGDFATWTDSDTIATWTHKDSNNNGGGGEISQVGSGEVNGGSGTGSANFHCTTPVTMHLTTPSILDVGKVYKFILDVSYYNSGKIRLKDAGDYGASDIIDGKIIGYFLSSVAWWRIQGSDTAQFTVDNVTLQLVNGNSGIMTNFDSLDFRTNVPQIYDKALFSNSLVFDGTDDYVDISSIGDLAGEFTWSLWFKVSDESSNRRILGNVSSLNTLYITPSENIYAKIANGTLLTSNATVSTTAWNHLVYTRDGDNKCKFYLNGAEVGINDGTGSFVTGGIVRTGTLDINYIGRDSSDYASMTVSDVGLYSEAVDATNVTAMYNSGKPIDLTCDAGNYNNANNLVGYWKMGDGYLDVLPSATHGGAIYDQATPVEGSDISIYDGEDVNVSAYANIEGNTVTTVQSGCVYKFNYTITNYVSGSFRIRQSSGASSLNVTGGTGNGNGNYEFYLLTTNTNNFVIDAYNLGFVGTISNYEVRKVEGNVGLAQNMNASAQSISVPE
jgi:hypothetical protein